MELELERSEVLTPFLCRRQIRVSETKKQVRRTRLIPLSIVHPTPVLYEMLSSLSLYKRNGHSYSVNFNLRYKLKILK